MNVRKTIFMVCMMCMGAGGVCVSQSLGDDVMVVCNANGCDRSANRSDIRKIFLGKKSRWNSGSKIQLAILKDGPVNDAFLKTYVNKSANSYNQFWKKLVFTGKSSAPHRFSSERELIDFVEHTEGAVGYVEKGAVPGNTIVLSIQ